MNEFDEESGLYNVIKICDFKIGRNRKRFISRYTKDCDHLSMEIDDSTNRVKCAKCNEILDTYWAIKYLVTVWSDYESGINEKIKYLEELKDKTLHYRAAKNVETHLRSKRSSPSCPHCKEGLLAEDFLNLGRVSKDLVIQKRKDKK